MPCKHPETGFQVMKPNNPALEPELGVGFKLCGFKRYLIGIPFTLCVCTCVCVHAHMHMAIFSP